MPTSSGHRIRSPHARRFRNARRQRRRPCCRHSAALRAARGTAQGVAGGTVQRGARGTALRAVSGTAQGVAGGTAQTGVRGSALRAARGTAQGVARGTVQRRARGTAPRATRGTAQGVARGTAQRAGRGSRHCSRRWRRHCRQSTVRRDQLCLVDTRRLVPPWVQGQGTQSMALAGEARAQTGCLPARRQAGRPPTCTCGRRSYRCRGWGGRGTAAGAAARSRRGHGSTSCPCRDGRGLHRNCCSSHGRHRHYRRRCGRCGLRHRSHHGLRRGLHRRSLHGVHCGCHDTCKVREAGVVGRARSAAQRSSPWPRLRRRGELAWRGGGSPTAVVSPGVARDSLPVTQRI
jgi:hypothetical protein